MTDLVRPIDPLAFLRALDDRDLARSLERAEAAEEVAALLSILERLPAVPPGWTSGRRLAGFLRLRLAGLSLAEVGRGMGRSTELARVALLEARRRLRHLPR